MLKKQLLLAHRGYSAIAPENTTLAFELAYQFGFDGVELDVHQTIDGELVVIHDETTDRTTLKDYAIAKSKFATIENLNYGAFFNIEVPHQKLLTLEEFLTMFLDKFTVINVEIKTDIVQYLGIEKNIYQVISKFPTAKAKIIFSSFNFESLTKMHELDNELKLGFLFWTHRQFTKIDSKRIQKVCQFLHPWTQIYDKNKAIYSKLNLPFLLWTLRSEQNYKKYLKDKKVLGQISNYKY
ncbi:glycerophosphodiester phosphodiesterase family protein [Candidatus Mycoplasma pogonae]